MKAQALTALLALTATTAHAQSAGERAPRALPPSCYATAAETATKLLVAKKVLSPNSNFLLQTLSAERSPGGATFDAVVALAGTSRGKKITHCLNLSIRMDSTCEVQDATLVSHEIADTDFWGTSESSLAQCDGAGGWWQPEPTDGDRSESGRTRGRKK